MTIDFLWDRIHRGTKFHSAISYKSYIPFTILMIIIRMTFSNSIGIRYYIFMQRYLFYELGKGEISNNHLAGLISFSEYVEIK